MFQDMTIDGVVLQDLLRVRAIMHEYRWPVPKADEVAEHEMASFTDADKILKTGSICSTAEADAAIAAAILCVQE